MKKNIQKTMSEHYVDRLVHMQKELRIISKDTNVKGAVGMDLFNAIDSINAALRDDTNPAMK